MIQNSKAIIELKVKVIILTIFFLGTLTSAKCQQFFKGSIVAGINASQIDGDNLAGYDKFGFTAGAKVEFPLNSVLDFGLEFLISQRGSRSQIFPGQFIDIQQIHLNYAELPIIIKWSDWWVEEHEFYRFNIHGGISLGRLISAKTNFSPSAISGNFVNNDISLLLGSGFSYSKNWTFSIRFTRSLNRLYIQEIANQEQFSGLVGYFVTVRSEYNF